MIHYSSYLSSSVSTVVSLLFFQPFSHDNLHFFFTKTRQKMGGRIYPAGVAVDSASVSSHTRVGRMTKTYCTLYITIISVLILYKLLLLLQYYY